MLLRRLLDSGAQSSSHGSIKIFTEEEIKEATNNYHETRILGEGGQGVVFKGILSDSTQVAVKKSRLGDPNQVPHFINEIYLLSQIQHEHVVRLIGCCLQTEIPLLVYELRIASEVASTLAHLHSSTMPIVHRDIKPANVLLDVFLKAKVCDFGSSRVVPADQDQGKTLVQGTIGYLDPEYLHTGTLSEKSDVYAFGVILMELVTGQPALCLHRPNNTKHITTYLESAVANNSLNDLLDQRVVNAENQTQLYQIAMLAVKCASVIGDTRPTMVHVAAQIEKLRFHI
ncbi:unnamed protein product [Cochlearia groenlandica]